LLKDFGMVILSENVIPGLASSVSASGVERVYSQFAPLFSEMGASQVTTPAVTITTSQVVSEPSGAAPSLNAADALLEELVLTAIDQFYVMMDRCAGLALSSGRHISFLRSILENNVENIRKVGGEERAEPFAARVIQFGQELDDLRRLESTNIEGILGLALTSMRLDMTRLLDEIKKKKEEAERTYDRTQLAYQDSLAAYHVSETAAQAADSMIAHSREVIMKAQALLEENERILDLEKKKMEEISVQNHSLFDDLGALHSEIDSAIVEYNRQLAITKEEMQRRALESIQNTHLKAIEDSGDKIRKLSRRE